MPSAPASPGAWPVEHGVPLNPEQGGWHWVARGKSAPRPWLWGPKAGKEGMWLLGDAGKVGGMHGTTYHGPCHTSATVAAAAAGAREEERRKMAVVAECQFDDRSRMRSENIDWNDGYHEACRDIAAAIRARGGE